MIIVRKKPTSKLEGSFAVKEQVRMPTTLLHTHLSKIEFDLQEFFQQKMYLWEGYSSLTRST